MSKSFAQLQLKLERDRLQRTHKRKPADAQGGQRAKSPRKRARRVAKPGVPLQPTLKRHCPLLSHVLERRSPACDGKIVVFPANVPALTQQTRYVLVFRRMGQASLALHTSTLELEPQPGARYAMVPGTPVVTLTLSGASYKLLMDRQTSQSATQYSRQALKPDDWESGRRWAKVYELTARDAFLLTAEDDICIDHCVKQRLSTANGQATSTEPHYLRSILGTLEKARSSLHATMRRTKARDGACKASQLQRIAYCWVTQ
eukprot:COSAG02_NODE_2173_length_9590_cov_39.075229_1_plen_259_part_10